MTGDERNGMDGAEDGREVGKRIEMKIRWENKMRKRVGRDEGNVMDSKVRILERIGSGKTRLQICRYGERKVGIKYIIKKDGLWTDGQ